MKSESFQAILENELAQIYENGQFSALSLSDESGLVLATVGDHELANIASAISSLSLAYKKTVQEQLHFQNIDEVSTVGDDKHRFVNRFISVEESNYILSAIVAPQQSYRRLTNTAVQRIKRILSTKSSKQEGE